MEPLIVLVAPASTDLSLLTRKLWAERIPHRVVEDNQGQQCLLLADPADLPRVQNWLELWRLGHIEDAPTVKPARTNTAFQVLQQAPVSTCIIAVITLVFLWMQFSTAWYGWLETAQQYWPAERFTWAAYANANIWDWWRPTLLHFSLLHLVFNSLWLWILAPRIERFDGVVPLLMLLIVCGLVGNIVQWWYAGPAFGGISGVTMGMLGWVGLRLRRVPYQFSSMMLPIMVGIMVLSIAADTFFSGITGSAHGAHIGGLLAGMLLGVLWPTKPDYSNISRGIDDSRTTD